MSAPPLLPAQPGFSAEWLTLREPFDLAARAAGAAVPAMAAHLERWRQARAGDDLAVLDLACGHGANLRALAPRLGGPQRWRLVDHDPALLAALPDALARWSAQQGYHFTQQVDSTAAPPGCHLRGPGFSAQVSCERLDLAQALGLLNIAPETLITASAWLDLVSAAWLDTLVQRAQGAGSAMLWALSVDGRTVWHPPDADDAAVHALFSQHQQRDKGFGPALGPRAPAVALQRLARAGYRCTTARTDWLIHGAPAPAMLRAMISGIAAAAREQAQSEQVQVQAQVQAWQARREAGIGDSQLRVGHVDILATPR